MDEIKKQVLAETATMIKLRRTLHQHPELGYQEHNTAKLIETVLKDIGLADVRRVTGTGVTGLLQGALPGKTLLLRADIDALPIQEESGEDFASTTPEIMHACAHDAHTAILLTTAKVLAGLKDSLPGAIRFVFEPNEEEVGALPMIESGIMDNPKVDAALGLHLWSMLPVGSIALVDGACWAGMDHFSIQVKGKGGHTSAPHTGVDPILVAAQIIQALQVMQSREQDPFLSSSLVFGTINGGTAANIIPDTVEMTGTLRYLFDGSDDGPYKPRLRLKTIAENIATVFRAEAEVDFYCSQPALINDPHMAELGRSVAVEMLGSKALCDLLNMGGEDFSEFAARVPAAFSMIGCGSQAAGAVYPHHNSKFRIDENALPIALEWLLRTSLKYLHQEA